MEGILTMSQKEADRIKIISQVEGKAVTIEEASELMSLSQRQVYRIVKRIRENGTKGIIHKLRGKNQTVAIPRF
jgi:transposase